MKKHAQRWVIWVGLVISAIFLYLAFRQISYAELLASLRQSKLWWLIPGLVIYFGSMLVRTWRWQYLLNPIQKVPARSLWSTIFIGYMGNNVFPLRMGEVLRTIVLKRRHDIAISASLATIVVEKIFDAVVILGFVLLNLGQLTALPGSGSFSQLGSLATWAAVLFAIGLAVFFAIALFPKPAAQVIHRVLKALLPERFREPLINIADRFLDGLKSLRSPREAIMIFLTSVLVWLLETGLYWGVSQASGLELNFRQLLLLNGVVNMVLLIPAAPGGLGTFDAAGRAMLQAYGIQPEPALGYTLILRMAIWIPVTLLGAYYFVREGLKWTVDLKTMQNQAEHSQNNDAKGNTHEG